MTWVYDHTDALRSPMLEPVSDGEFLAQLEQTRERERVRHSIAAHREVESNPHTRIGY